MVAERQDFPMARLELFHAGRDECCELSGDSLPRRIRRVGRDEIGEGRVIVVGQRAIERERGVAATAEKIPITIAGEVNGDAIQPSRERGVAAKYGEPIGARG